jgi:glutamyl-tRNA synthetase
MGIVPEAFRNFLALLGWTPRLSGSAQVKDDAGKDRELFGSDELQGLFSLEGISKSNAVFDNDKLAWFNTEWIRRYPAEKLLPLIEVEWDKAGFEPDRSAEEILATIDLVKQRARNLTDFAGSFRAYFSDNYPYDAAAVTKFLNDAATRMLLVELASRYESAAEFSEASTEQVLRGFAEEKGLKAGVLINGARVALTGQGVAPSLFTVMVALGQQRVVARLKRCEEAVAV